jgi:hypothetical protein
MKLLIPRQKPTRYWPLTTSIAANNLTPWRFPCRVDGHSARGWFEDGQALRQFADWLLADKGTGPRRFRAWAMFGNGERHTGGWVAHADLPIWEPGTTEEQLRAQYGELD